MNRFRSYNVATLALVGAWLAALCACADEAPTFDTQQNAPRLTTPAEAVAAFRVSEGFRVTLFAAEPDVRQPIGIATDARGRVWVAENYTYAEGPGSFDARQRDRIVVLADTDGDGRSDRRRVFWDQAVQLTSVEVGLGGVWALCPPQLLFLPDRDGDDQPDGPPQVMLDGFDVGPANRHNFANGLRWGPDGWLYGRNGISHTGHVGAPGTPSERRVEVGPGMWRYHPLRKKFEVVATGTTNPWGHDWDKHGELFFINTVIGHLWHVVPGAHFKRMFGADSNPYVYQLLDQTADHVHWDAREAWQDVRRAVSQTTAEAGGGHAHSGLVIYQGDQWPQEYRDRAYAINLHGRRLNCDHIQRHGASYIARHGQDCFFTSDPWFRGIDLVPAPDGGVLLVDWSDVGECHEADGVHRSSGRVFHLGYGLERRPLPDLIGASANQLVELLTDRNEWIARQARQTLRERHLDPQSDTRALRDNLRNRFSEADQSTHWLRYLWALYVTDRADEAWLRQQLGHPNEHVRAWVVRLLVEHDSLSRAASERLVQQALSEESGLVLLYLASSLQKLPVTQRGELGAALAGLVRTPDLAQDRVYPLILWYGLEPWVTTDWDNALLLSANAQIPLIRQFAARRLTQHAAAYPAVLEALAVLLAETADGVVRRDLLTGMAEALRGVRRMDPPPSWSKVQRATQRDDERTLALVRKISVVFGDGQAVDELRRLAQDKSADPDARRAAIQSLVTARPDDGAQFLQSLLGDFDVAEAAIRGLAAFDDPHTPELLVEGVGRMHPTARDAALDTLVARPNFAHALVEAVAGGRLDRDLISVTQVRQMYALGEEKLTGALQRAWPELRPLSGDRGRTIVELKQRLSGQGLESADLRAGRRHWDKSCAKCHTLFGEGGKIGPDLTGSQRSNLDFLVENIVDPSATLAENFRLTTLSLTDGRVIQGVVLTRTEQTWEVQTATDRVAIAVKDIEQHEPTRLSLMPDGLLDLLSPPEIRDLFAYLMSPAQVAGE